MKQSLFIAIVCLMVFNSCSPTISKSISKQTPPLEYKQDVTVYDLNESPPSNTVEIGTIKIGDSGFTVNCSWDVVIDKSKLEARKMGGNVVKIIEHHLPNPFGSSCHRITALVLKTDSSTECEKAHPSIDSTFLKADYALIHLYRPNGYGYLLNYDVNLGDTVIWTSSNNAKKTIRIKKDGLNSIWASTEAKSEIPIDIKIGKEYYLRCSVTFGAFVGHPKIELIDNESGRMEYGFIKMKKSEVRDYIILNSGKEIVCRINSEDAENVYILQMDDELDKNSVIPKKSIQYIQKAD